MTEHSDRPDDDTEPTAAEVKERLYAWVAMGLLAVQFDDPDKFTDYSSTADAKRAHSQLHDYVRARMGVAALPTGTESFAISVGKPKTAALCFDRVYAAPIVMEPTPADVGFYGATAAEIYLWAQIRFQLEGFLTRSPGDQLPVAEEEVLSPAEEGRRTTEFVDGLVSEYYSRAYGTHPTIVFSSRRARNAGLQRGAARSLALALEGIGVVDEERLDWEQVSEFRRDDSSRIKYRRLMRWFDERSDLTESQLEDEIAVRLDDYEWAIKKHGLKLVAGSINALLDPKFLTSAAAVTAGASVLAGGMAGAGVGLTVGIGKAIASITTEAVDVLDDRRSRGLQQNLWVVSDSGS